MLLPCSWHFNRRDGVADITSVAARKEWSYLSWFIDVASHFYKTLEIEGALWALKMALEFNKRLHVDLNKLIYHSDRGIQYGSNQYVAVLMEKYICYQYDSM